MFQNLREKKFIQGVKKTGFEILGMKGFKLKFGVLEKSIWVLEEVLEVLEICL